MTLYFQWTCSAPVDVLRMIVKVLIVCETIFFSTVLLWQYYLMLLKMNSFAHVEHILWDPECFDKFVFFSASSLKCQALSLLAMFKPECMHVFMHCFTDCIL